MPLRHFVLVLLLTACAAGPAWSQDRDAAAPVHNLALFEPLDLAAVNDFRSASGRPGVAYWQQRADYAIDVTLDPETHRVGGTETITYTNNSPQPVEQLWLQLDQNLFATGSRGATIQPPDSRWRGSFSEGGFDLTRVDVVHDGRRYAPDALVEDTRLRIPLATPLAADGGTLDLEIDFSFRVPNYGADRMGRLDVERGTVYEIAQWYPRMFVFDDVHGWNAMPYLGQGEFYLDYGTFDVAITVPRDFVVVATGTLENPEEVLTEDQQRRLEAARRSAETVHLIAPDEVGRPGTRPAGEGPLTWRFRAENVRDVAWAASQAFIWDAASWEDVLVQSAYPHEGLGDERQPGWEASTQYGRHSIRHYSEQWYDYPYPVAINVGGIVGGMEYPMIVFCSVRARGEGLFGVTDHEFGHSWFPMIVGSDERRHAWMDEGFNSFINYYSKRAFYGDGARRNGSMASDYVAAMMQNPAFDQPAATPADRIRRRSLGFLAYRKPAKGLVILREYILGPERFDAAFRAYIERWAFKHPQPADFFRTIEDVAGEELDWFWRGWLYGTGVLDQAVAEVVREAGQTRVTVLQEEGLVLPVEVEATYGDGRTERHRIPVEAFATSDAFTTVLPSEDVTRVTLDPDRMLPDVARANNTWRADAPVDTPAEPGG